MAENVSAEQVDLQTQNNKVSQQRNLLVLVSEWSEWTCKKVFCKETKCDRFEAGVNLVLIVG